MIIKIKTKKKIELVDITEKIIRLVKQSRVFHGICFVFNPHTTSGLLLNERESGLKKDFIEFFNQILSIIKNHKNYFHDKVDKRENAPSHLSASLLGLPSIVLPIRKGNLLLGKFQNVFLLELDGPRERKINLEIFSTGG